MAKFFKPSKAKSKSPVTVQLDIEHYNHDGDGIGYLDGKICFVQGALPGERVKARLVENKAKVKKAHTVKLLEPHPERKAPNCAHFEHCGGCHLQFIDRDLQLEFKQQAVESLFKRFGKLDSLPWQSPLTSEPWHYRRAARIGVWFEKQSKTFTVGFRKRNSNQLTNIELCPVLSKAFCNIFAEFSHILPQLSAGQYVTHLEVVRADNVNLVVVRHTKAFKDSDKSKLIELGKKHQWVIVSEGHKGQFESLDESSLPVLDYGLSAYDIQLHFRVGDFIQVNSDINEQMIAQAIDWLDVQQSDQILDLFCGIGNFSLPLATRSLRVVGVEGVDAMVEQACHNAQLNNIDNAAFHQADLSQDFVKKPPQWLKADYDKVLLDPARAGAEAMMKPLGKCKPDKILYVSCDPFTCARDSAILLQQGYQLRKIALMDMFSHTRHVEVMALFER